MENIYSNKIFTTFLAYLDKHHGREVTGRVLSESGTDRLAVAQPGGFQTDEFGARFSEAVIRITGVEDIHYRVGRSIDESIGKIGGMILGLTSPHLCMKMLQLVEERVALKTTTQTESLGRNKYRVRVSFKDGFQEAVYACQNRIGSYEAFPRFFGLPYAKVEHPECVFRDGQRCEYIVTVPNYGFIHLRTVALILLLAGTVLCVLNLSGVLAESAVVASITCLLAGLSSFAVFKHMQAKRSNEWTLLANEGLAEQNRELEKNNIRNHSVQELTLSLGQVNSIQSICDLSVSTLIRSFSYGSGQIWILNDVGTRFGCRAAKGYDADLETLLRGSDPEAEEGGANPFGLVKRTMAKGETLIVNEVAEEVATLSSRAKEFYTLLNPSSFMLTPLFQAETTIGVLAVEHLHGRKMDQSDRVLFQSLSHIIANALVKAGLIEQMGEKIRQLQLAKEMAIQSEKLSSLGQMVAGVAHEINNPLNFLVNIIPDVRRDIDGLEKIRAVAVKAGLPLPATAEIKKLDEEYDLETHLEEKEFVFGKIHKALQKGLQIAGSLKAFSRLSAKESVSEESFATMMKDVLDLIPNKIRGETQITVDIPADLAWNVNKNEMEQAFLAIINNAIDALEQKGRIEIAGRVWLGDILITIKDNGPGIPADVQKKIFEAFFTTKPAGKGTGLGLSIAGELTRKFGGLLELESAPGKGATFIFRFPMAVQTEASLVS